MKVTTYTLTLKTGERNSLNDSRHLVPEPYQRTCGHRHRKVSKAMACYVPGQPGGMAPTQVVANDLTYPYSRALTEDEIYTAWDEIDAR